MAKKKNSPSLIDLMSSTTSTEDANRAVNRAVDQIHGKAEVTTPLIVNEPKKKKIKMVRVSVDTPEDVHKELKKIIPDLDMDLKTFYLTAVREKCERMGYPLPSTIDDILK